MSRICFEKDLFVLIPFITKIRVKVYTNISSVVKSIKLDIMIDLVVSLNVSIEMGCQILNCNFRLNP